MARNEWTRWGRGECIGYNLEIGDSYSRFHASVVRNVFDHQLGRYTWYAAINGRESKQYDTCEQAMAEIEFDLKITGDLFVETYKGYLEKREKNLLSKAVDALKRPPPREI
jgi:hypothetical protein